MPVVEVPQAAPASADDDAIPQPADDGIGDDDLDDDGMEDDDLDDDAWDDLEDDAEEDLLDDDEDDDPKPGPLVVRRARARS